MIRELPVEPVVAALATLPINVLLAVGEHMVAGKRQPLFNRTDTAAALLGDRSRIHTVLNLHIWAPESDDERRPGSLAEAGTSSTRELPDDVVRTSRFLGLPDRDGGEPDETVRYDVVHCIGSIGKNYDDDPLMFLGVGRHLMLSPGTLRDALVRCGTRLLILQSLGYHYRGGSAERLAEFVAGAGGPAVLVVADDERHDVNAYLRDLYGRILGNQPIEEAAAAAAGGPETLFAHGTGGHRLLRFDSMMEHLEQQLRDYAGLVDELLYGIRNLERGGLAVRHVASDDELRSLHKLQSWIVAALAELARARTSVGAHAAEGAILLAAVVAEASRIKAEIAHVSGEGHLHTKFDMLAYRIGEALRFDTDADPGSYVVAPATPDKSVMDLLPATGAQFYCVLEGEATRGNVVQYGTEVDLVFNYDTPPADSLASMEGEELEHVRVQSLTLGVTVIPKGFEFLAKKKWYQTARFHRGKLVRPLRFPLRALDAATITSNMAELIPSDTAPSSYRTGFHILFDHRGAKLYQLFLATRLVYSQVEVNEAAADYRPPRIDLDKIYRLASIMASSAAAPSG